MTSDGGSGRRAGRRWLWAVAGVAAAGAVCAVVGVWHLPARMYPADAPEARAALQGGLLTAAAALVAVAGGLIALDETRQANAEVRRANAEIRRANERTHVRELYTAAIGQLGSDTLDVRLGGIYTLERIATDSPDDQRTVVEVLSAFVREHTIPGRPGTLRRQRDRPAPPPEPSGGEAPPAPDATGPDTDIQAALTVLGRLPPRASVPRADLTGAVLIGAVLSEANLTGAELSGVNLTRAELGEASLTGVRLSRANLTDARLSRADLTHAELYRANATRAQLVEANLTGAMLDRADLSGALLDGADVSGVHLFGADLSGASLDRAKLTGAGMLDAKLTGAVLGSADLTGAVLFTTDLAGADLSGAVGLESGQLEVTAGDRRTRLPDGYPRPDFWPRFDPGGDPS